MPKGIFTQSACVLLSKPIAIEWVEKALQPFKIAGRRNVKAQSPWFSCGEELVIAFRPEIRGYVVVDMIDRPWPDSMGNPKGSEEDKWLFGAWSTQQFGPYVWPGGLHRATQHDWGKLLASAAQAHQGFIRVRSTYGIGAADDDPILPDDYEAYKELVFVTEVARALLRLKSALCYYNPNGESLRTREFLDNSAKDRKDKGVPPYAVWSNSRFYRFHDAEGWAIIDTVGMHQLDIPFGEDQLYVPDQEACFVVESHDLSAIGTFLYGAAHYVRENGPIINDGDTMDGPGDVPWRAKHFKEGIVEPPREVIRWFPEDGSKAPKPLRSRKKPAG